EIAEAPVAQPQPIVLQSIVESAHMGRQHVVFVLPPHYNDDPQSRWPAVLTFAGLGESKRGNRAGAWGWVEMYGVVPAMAALHRNALAPDDLQGLLEPEELDAYNKVLTETPYRGVVLVCPYPPQRSSDAYERFLIEELVPYTNAQLRIFPEPERWGIDGISMGGMLSTVIGFSQAEHFGAFGSQQSSLSYSPRLQNMIDQHRQQLEGKPINIATSTYDGFRRSLTTLSQRLNDTHLNHRFTILPGRHNKRFVKGPGSIELLLFHDRALWGHGAMPPAVDVR
ncbi:MAG: alpha/beta hydrolase-fold protein, partial [Myxococcota bacterium]